MLGRQKGDGGETEKRGVGETARQMLKNKQVGTLALEGISSLGDQLQWDAMPQQATLPSCSTHYRGHSEFQTFRINLQFDLLHGSVCLPEISFNFFP